MSEKEHLKHCIFFCFSIKEKCCSDCWNDLFRFGWGCCDP